MDEVADVPAPQVSPRRVLAARSGALAALGSMATAVVVLLGAGAVGPELGARPAPHVLPGEGLLVLPPLEPSDLGRRGVGPAASVLRVGAAPEQIGDRLLGGGSGSAPRAGKGGPATRAVSGLVGQAAGVLRVPVAAGARPLQGLSGDGSLSSAALDVPLSGWVTAAARWGADAAAADRARGALAMAATSAAEARSAAVSRATPAGSAQEAGRPGRADGKAVRKASVRKAAGKAARPRIAVPGAGRTAGTRPSGSKGTAGTAAGKAAPQRVGTQTPATKRATGDNKATGKKPTAKKATSKKRPTADEPTAKKKATSKKKAASKKGTAKKKKASSRTKPAAAKKD